MHRPPGVLLGIGLAGVLTLGLMFWANLSFALAHPGGNDFLPYWIATRAFVYEGVSPYSPQVALRIQYAAYGRPAYPGENRLGVVYPFYALAIYLPFALIPAYPWARALWMTLLETALLTTAWASRRLIGWPQNAGGLSLLLIFALTWYYGLRGVVNGNAVVLATLLLTLAPLALSQGRETWAGVLLALSTLKPNVALLPVAAALIWAWTAHRPRVWKALLGTLALLLTLATLLHPWWWREYLAEIRAYPAYNPPASVWEALWVRDPRAAWALALPLYAIVLLLLLRAWKAMYRNPAWPSPLWAYMVTLLAGQWLIPNDPGNFVALLLPVTWVAGQLARRHPILSWAWLIGVWMGLWWLFLATMTPGLHGPQQHDVMFFPLPTLLWIGLMGMPPEPTRREG